MVLVVLELMLVFLGVVDRIKSSQRPSYGSDTVFGTMLRANTGSEGENFSSRLVNSNMFQCVINITIVINAVQMGLAVEHPGLSMWTSPG